MFLSICDNPDVLSIMRIIKIIINIIMVIAPIILIISLMFSFTNVVKSNDDDALMKEFKNAIPKIIATLLIFFVPTIINIILSVTLNVPYKQCFNSATTEGISSAYINIAKDSLNSAKKSLKDSDLQKAKNAISKITDNSVKEELNKEAELISEYVDINNILSELKTNFNSKKYEDVKSKIEKIEDKETQEKFTKILSTISKSLNVTAGAFSQYDNDSKMNYYIVVPEEATENMPIIVYIHGGEVCYPEGTAIAKATKTGEAYKYGKFIYLVPCWMEGGKRLEAAYKLILKIIDEYKINKDKVS